MQQHRKLKEEVNEMSYRAGPRAMRRENWRTERVDRESPRGSNGLPALALTTTTAEEAGRAATAGGCLFACRHWRIGKSGGMGEETHDRRESAGLVAQFEPVYHCRGKVLHRSMQRGRRQPERLFEQRGDSAGRGAGHLKDVTEEDIEIANSAYEEQVTDV